MGTILVFLLVAGSLLADGIPRDEYRARRAELRKSLDGVMILFGASESEDCIAPFFKTDNFLYFSNWREPGAIMILSPKEEILFLPPRDRLGGDFQGQNWALKAGIVRRSRNRKSPPHPWFRDQLPASARILKSSLYGPGGYESAETKAVGAFSRGRIGAAGDRKIANDQVTRRD